jgi:hypothetical protein
VSKLIGRLKPKRELTGQHSSIYEAIGAGGGRRLFGNGTLGSICRIVSFKSSAQFGTKFVDMMRLCVVLSLNA